jgi:hypothetical protein
MHEMKTIIIIIIIGIRASVELQPPLEDFPRLGYSWELHHSVFTLDFAAVNFLQSKVVNLASNP